MHHGETLVDDERAFRLPFDILRDCYFAPEAASRAGKGKGKGKGKGRVGGGEDEAPSGVRREGKGGDKTTAEDIAKREMSKKPPPYRYIGKSAFPSIPPSVSSRDEADRRPRRRLLQPPPGQGRAARHLHVQAPLQADRTGLRQRLHQPVRLDLPKCPSLKGSSLLSSPHLPADAPFGRRLMQYCCDPKKCPCGPDRCANLPLNKREGVPEGKDGLRVIWVRRGPLLLCPLL